MAFVLPKAVRHVLRNLPHGKKYPKWNAASQTYHFPLLPRLCFPIHSFRALWVESSEYKSLVPSKVNNNLPLSYFLPKRNLKEHLKNASKKQPKHKASSFCTSAHPARKKEDKPLPYTTKNSIGTQSDSPTTTACKTDIQDKRKKQPESTPQPIPTAEALRKKHWCSGDCPEEYRNSCGFRSAPTSLRYPNASGKLRVNLKEVHNPIYNVVKNISRTHNFSIAHHHLIPGNECYGKMDGEHHRYELLVKLGYLFDYDINTEENGILLPTSNSTLESIPLGENEITKAEYYYKIMDMDLRNDTSVASFPPSERDFVGSQLHIGQHTYDESLKTLREICPNAYKLRSYESIVISELDRLNNFYMDKYEDTCFMKNYESNKKAFFKHMNTIDNRLRKGINQFPNKDKEFSFLNKRIYVSFPAILYDMNISIKEYQKTYPRSKDIWKPSKGQEILNKLIERRKKCAITTSLPPKIQKGRIISTSTKR